MIRPSVALARIEDGITDLVLATRAAIGRRPLGRLEASLVLGLAAEIALAATRAVL